MGRFDGISLKNSFAESRNQFNINAPSASGSSGFSGVGGTAGTDDDSGAVAGAVISGLADIGTSFINSKRRKNAYEFNASMRDIQSRQRRLSADVEIKNIRRRSRELFGAQMAAFARAGLAFTGSASNLARRSLQLAELDVIYTNISAQFDINALKVGAELQRLKASQAKFATFQTIGKNILQVQQVIEEEKRKGRA